MLTQEMLLFTIVTKSREHPVYFVGAHIKDPQVFDYVYGYTCPSLILTHGSLKDLLDYVTDYVKNLGEGVLFRPGLIAPKTVEDIGPAIFDWEVVEGWYTKKSDPPTLYGVVISYSISKNWKVIRWTLHDSSSIANLTIQNVKNNEVLTNIRFDVDKLQFIDEETPGEVRRASRGRKLSLAMLLRG